MYWYKEKTNSDSFSENFQKNSVEHFIRYNFALFVVIAVFFGIFYFIYSSFNYIDPFEMCHLSIKSNVTSGNKKTIFEAIKLMKRNDYLAYKVLCMNVDTIYERNCFKAVGDSNRLEYTGSDGCYIKGTKSIFVIPEKVNSYDVVKKRTQIITLYSDISRQYWESQKK